MTDSRPIEASAEYFSADYTLSLKSNYKQEMARLSIGDLSMMFTQQDRLLAGLEAYTNDALWQHDHLFKPQIDKEAAVRCEEVFDENGIKDEPNAVVAFVYDASKELLLVRTSGERPSQSVRALSCALVSLSPQGELVEIWLEGIRRDVVCSGGGS